MEAEIVSILRSFGWTEGLHIPIANEENRILESKVEEVLKKRREVLSLLHDSKNNFISIQNYFDNIVEQRSQNEQMLVDYRKQLDAEERCLNDVRFEKENIIRQTRDVKKKSVQITDDNKRLQIQLDRVSLKCENLRKDIDWSKEMEDCLTESVNTGNSDIDLLEKYNLQDNVDFERMELKRLQLVAELDEYKILLNQKLSEMKAAEYESEKLSKLSDSLSRERQWLVGQWETSVGILRTRDKEIEDVIQEMNILMEVSRNVESEMLQRECFYKEQVRNNMEVDIQIRYILRELCNQQQMNDKLRCEMDLKTNELTDRRNELTGLGNSVLDQRTRNTAINREKNTKSELLKKLKSDCDKLTDKLQNLKTRSISITDRMQQLEQILQCEQRRFNLALQDRQKMDRMLQELKCKMASTEIKYTLITSEMKQLSHLQCKLNKTVEQYNVEIRKETELLTAVEQQIRDVGAKICFMQGENSTDLKVLQENELSRLTNDCNEKKKVLKTICDEVDICNTELKILNKEINSNLEKMNFLKDRKEKLTMQIDAEEKHLGKVVEENKDKEVTENMLRLRASQLEKALNKTSDAVFSLEKQKIELETALRERLLEIETSSNLLRIRKKALLEEISNLKRSIDHVDARTNQFMKRYEIVIDSVMKDEQGEPVTITNYKIKVNEVCSFMGHSPEAENIKLVKERCSLLEKGDDLDEKIRKSEKEIQAMENTLLLMNVSNTSYKKGLSPVDQNSKEYREKEELEQEYAKLLNVFRKNKRAMPELISEIEMLKKSLPELRDQEQKLQRMSKEKELELSQLERDVNEQCVKLQRVQNRLKSLKKSLKANENVNLLERDFLTKELHSINKTALSCVADIVARHPEMTANMNRYLSEKGIMLPKHLKMKKTRDVTPSSRRSSQDKLAETDNESSISVSVNSVTASKSIVNLDAHVLDDFHTRFQH